MTAHNDDKVSRAIIVFCIVFMWVGLPILFIVGIVHGSTTAGVALVAFLISWPFMVLYFKTAFCSFMIDEKGITRKLFGRSLFSAWDEFEYIGVGEHIGSDYKFYLYFSKTPPEKIYFRENQITKQDKGFYFIRYREGLLEEVLKYVDENRINDIERIRACPDPHKGQPRETSKGIQEGEPEREMEILEPKDQKEEE